MVPGPFAGRERCGPRWRGRLPTGPRAASVACRQRVSLPIRGVRFPHRAKAPGWERAGSSAVPVLAVRDGRILSDPSNAEVAEAFGVETGIGSQREFDVIVIGAGPAGLTAAVYASSEGLSTLVIDLAGVGGQAGTSSLIRNYLGFSRGISGGLAQRAYQQAWVFGARFSLMREARKLRWKKGSWVVVLDTGDEATGRTIVSATGVSLPPTRHPGAGATRWVRGLLRRIRLGGENAGRRPGLRCWRCELRWSGGNASRATRRT